MHWVMAWGNLLGLVLAQCRLPQKKTPVIVSLISVPFIVYAVQLAVHQNLLALRAVAKHGGMIVDDKGLKKFTLNLNLTKGE